MQTHRSQLNLKWEIHRGGTPTKPFFSLGIQLSFCPAAAASRLVAAKCASVTHIKREQQPGICHAFLHPLLNFCQNWLVQAMHNNVINRAFFIRGLCALDTDLVGSMLTIRLSVQKLIPQQRTPDNECSWNRLRKLDNSRNYPTSNQVPFSRGTQSHTNQIWLVVNLVSLRDSNSILITQRRISRLFICILS